MINNNEREFRITAFEKTLANFALEDIHISDDMKEVCNMYINGEISLAEQSELLREIILSK